MYQGREARWVPWCTFHDFSLSLVQTISKSLASTFLFARMNDAVGQRLCTSRGLVLSGQTSFVSLLFSLIFCVQPRDISYIQFISSYLLYSLRHTWREREKSLVIYKESLFCLFDLLGVFFKENPTTGLVLTFLGTHRKYLSLLVQRFIWKIVLSEDTNRM